MTFFKTTRVAKTLIGLTIGAVFLLAGHQRGYLNSSAVKRTFKVGSYFALDLLARVWPNQQGVHKLNVPFYRQEHSLSCEVATLKMVLEYYGIKVEEDDLIARLPFDTFGPRNVEENIWGDPNQGFVGDIDAKIPNGGYGVYEDPLVKLARDFREAKKLEYPALREVLEIVEAGYPVIVWGTISSGKDISWKTREGKKIKAVFGEHTRVVIGFKGTPESPSFIYLLDPIYGQVRMSREKFLKNWDSLDRKAVVVY